jgi:hypothetical protein
VVFKVAVFPLPLIVPLLAVKLLTETGTLSGLLHVQLTVTVAPACTLVGFAEQETVGGFLGGSLTVKVVEALASLFLFFFGSTTFTVTVQLPPGTPFVSTLAVVSFPVTLPHVLVQSYVSVCFGSKLLGAAVAVTGSPTMTSVGCTDTLVDGGVVSGYPKLVLRRGFILRYKVCWRQNGAKKQHQRRRWHENVHWGQASRHIDLRIDLEYRFT